MGSYRPPCEICVTFYPKVRIFTVSEPFCIIFEPANPILPDKKASFGLRSAQKHYLCMDFRVPPRIPEEGEAHDIPKQSAEAAKEITMEISELQRRVDEWIKTYGVRYFGELTNMAVLTEEVGELARIMARRYGDQSAKSGEECSKERMAEEMADIIWVVTCLANQTGVDLTAAIEASFAKKTSRDGKRHLQNPKLHETK